MSVEAAALIRHVAIVGIAGVIIGVIVGGIGGRVLMRIAAIVAPESATGAVTENGNVIGDITAGGTIALFIFFGILFGASGAIAYVISDQWMSWTRHGRPLAFALFITAIGAPNVFDPDNPDFLLVENQELIVGMFVALFLLYGIPMPWVVAALERRLPKVSPARPLESVVGYLCVVTLGSMLVPFILQSSFSEDYVTGVFVLGLGAATAMYWVTKYWIQMDEPWSTAARLAGYGSLVGAILAGSFRTFSDISDILPGDLL